MGTAASRDHASANEPPASPIALSAWQLARLREDAKQALTQSGWRPAVAGAAVDEACRAGAATTLEQLVFEACRRCAQLPC